MVVKEGAFMVGERVTSTLKQPAGLLKLFEAVDRFYYYYYIINKF